MSNNEEFKQYNLKLPTVLLDALKQYQVSETTRRNKVVSLRELIIEILDEKVGTILADKPTRALFAAKHNDFNVNG